MHNVHAAILVAAIAGLASGSPLAQTTGTNMDGMNGMKQKSTESMKPKDDMRSMDGMKSMEGNAGKSASTSGSHHGAGTVKSVDSTKGSIIIAHGPIKSLGWPAMTMTFKARDRQMASRVKPGDKVEFTFDQTGKDYVITGIK